MTTKKTRKRPQLSLNRDDFVDVGKQLFAAGIPVLLGFFFKKARDFDFGPTMEEAERIKKVTGEALR